LYPSFSSSQLNDLIDACDKEPDQCSEGEKLYSPFSVFQHHKVVNTFTEGENVLDIFSSETVKSPAETPIATVNPGNDYEMISLPPYQFAATWKLTLPMAPQAENRLDPKYNYLFNHFCNHVAPLMTPVPSSKNPWRRYPAIALHRSFASGHKYLLHALMSLSAVHLGNIGGNLLAMHALGRNLYSRAMAELRSCLESGSLRYMDMLMTMMIFLFIEVSNAYEE
jgi:hypothetical protein